MILTDESIATIRSVFANLTEQELAVITSSFQTMEYKSGQLILTQDSRESNLYLIVKGRAIVAVTLPGDGLKETSLLKENQLFGEVSFLGNTLITANIIAKTPMVCLVLCQSVLTMLHLAYPEIAFKIEQAIVKQTIIKIVKNFQRIENLLMIVNRYHSVTKGHAQHLINQAATASLLPVESLNREYLCQMPFFHLLSAEQLDTLLPMTQTRLCDKGYDYTTIESKKVVNVICSGAVMLFIKKNNCLLKSIGVLNMGRLFIQEGFTSPFDKYCHYVTCEKSAILQLDWQVYNQLRYQHPAIFYKTSRMLHSSIVNLFYILNRQFIRMNCEYQDLIARG